MAFRVPFNFALMDRRHRSFVEGERGAFLTLFQWIVEPSRFMVVSKVLLAAFALCLGASGLMHDFLVEWNTAEAVITQVVPMQSQDHVNWWYLYSFKTTTGQIAQGQIVRSERNRFSEGDRIPVVYVRNEPQDNRYANEPMPRSTLYWTLVGVGVVVLGLHSFWFRREIDEYRALRRLARLGHPVPGEVIETRWVGFPTNRKLDIEFMFSTLEGCDVNAHVQVSQSHFADKAEPGVVVAVWYSADEGALLM